MISLFKVFMADNASVEVSKVLKSGMITQATKVREFEEKLQEWFDYPYILTLNSATSGLTMALRMFNLSPGDEVLASPLTCMATTVPILANNLHIKWVDTNPNTCNMDLADLRNKITHKTKAIVLVHWGGSPIDLNEVENIKQYAKDKYGTNLKVLEDCAHSMGSEFKGSKIGTHGNYCVFSLQAIKHLTTGDGGLIFLPNEAEYERAKLLRWYGIDREQRSGVGKDFRLESDIAEWGYKFHMNDINASIGIANLPFIDGNLAKIRGNAEYYKSRLNNLSNVKLLEQVDDCKSAYWIYSIKVSDKPSFISFMTDSNIMVSQIHKRNDNHSCVSQFKSNLPALDQFETKLISIPVGWWLTTDERAYIANKVVEWNLSFEDREWNLRLIKNDEQDCNHYGILIKQLNGMEPVSYNIYNEKYNTLINDTTVTVLISVDTLVVGTGRLTVEYKMRDPLCYINDIVVDSMYRKKGVGVKIVSYLTEFAKTFGCYKIVLSCKDELNEFYSKNNYKKEGGQMVYRV